jgi:hypothetical protein
VISYLKELRIREEQARVETGRYVPLGPYTGRTLPDDWKAIRFIAPLDEVSCVYDVEAGAGHWVATARCGSRRFQTSSTDPGITEVRVSTARRSCRLRLASWPC